jgi:SAM-dependent methyltransferase
VIEHALRNPSRFQEALFHRQPQSRDRWVDQLLELGELPEDGPDLPRGCTPYLPCSVDILLRTVQRARVTSSDIFVDVGSGLGRAMAFVHLVTGAGAIGLEVQSGMARAARELAARSRLTRVSTVEGDAASNAGFIAIGSVFFFYCPFGGDRLSKVLDDLAPIARTRMLRLCFVDMPQPRRPWLSREPSDSESPTGRLIVCRTTLHDESFAGATERNARALAALEAGP